MKLPSTLILLCVFFTSCQKEPRLTEEEKKIIEVNKGKLFGKRNFVSEVKPGVVATNANPCYADNWLEFRQDGKGTISQGPCKDNPAIHEEQDFAWKFKDTVNIDFGDNEIRLTKLNDSILNFIVLSTSSGQANDEFHWKK